MVVFHAGEGGRCNHGSIEGLQLWKCREDRRLKHYKHIKDAGNAVVTSKGLGAELGTSQQCFEIAKLNRNFAISCPESTVSFRRVRGILCLTVYI